MSSGTIAPPPPPETFVVPPPTECEILIERRLRQTRRQVKGVDIAAGLITLLIGVLAYLLAAAAIDHWLIQGGLGFRGRTLLWLALVSAAGTYFVHRLLPPLLRRINPIFAADTIERSRPSLKNSLINFLLLRGRRQEVAPLVYRAMEHRAAADMAGVEVDVAVDRTHVIRLGYVLVGVLAVFALYLILSPKSPIRSAARVLLPWSSIEAPTRVTIHDVQPGNAAAFHGDSVAISAEIAGLRDGEPAHVIYSTADGQTVDEAIPMVRPEGGFRYECRLPPGNLGLQQNYEYYLAAGDCKTGRYQIEVQIAPSIDVDKVSYHYPAYTRIDDQTTERQGDLRAIEGTEVTICATANCEIKPGSAEIDLGCTGRPGLNKMTVEGRSAVGRLTLRVNPKDAALPEYDSYQLRFADAQGRENGRPIRHRIEVSRDLPPVVRLVEPQKEEVQVPVDGKLPISVRAEQDDFGLRLVALRAERDGRSLLIRPLLEKRPPESAWPGAFAAVYAFEPARLGLKAGDRVQYWAEAEDNKEPLPGRAASGKQWIVVVAPEKTPQPQQNPDGAQGEKTQPDKNKPQPEEAGKQPDGSTNPSEPSQAKPPDNSANKQPSTDGQPPKDSQSNPKKQESSDQPQQGEQGGSSESGQNQGKQGAGQSGQDKGQKEGGGKSSAEQQTGQSDQTRNERVDPNADPGTAMEQILKDRQKEQQEKSSTGQSESDKGQSGEQQKAPGEKAPGEKAPGEKAPGEKAPGEKAPGEKAPGEKAPGEKAPGEKAPGEKAPGEKAPGEKAPGEKAPGEKAPGEKAPGEKAPGEKAPGEKAPGEKAPGEKAPGEKAPGEKAPGEKAPGEKAPGEKAPGEKAPGEKAPGEKPGEIRPDQQQSPSAGKKSENTSASPAPQEANRPNQKKPGDVADAPSQQKNDQAQSPSTSKTQSNAQGANEGDRSGHGGKGGGERGNKPGVGSPGSHTAANEGGGEAKEPGEGTVGKNPGEQTRANKPTGSAAKTQAENGAGTGEKKPGEKGNGEKPSKENNLAKDGAPQQEPAKGTPGNAAAEQSKGQASGNPTGGGKPGEPSGTAAPPEPVETPADQANLKYARRQSELAIEHLRDQLAKEKPKLLEQLGWSKDEAQQFLDRWERMREAAAQKGSAGDAARKQYDDALKSLGLRPRGAELRPGGIGPEQPQNLRDTGRFAPPPDWAEQFREYTRGVAGGERK